MRALVQISSLSPPRLYFTVTTILDHLFKMFAPGARQPSAYSTPPYPALPQDHLPHLVMRTLAAGEIGGGGQDPWVWEHLWGRVSPGSLFRRL
jgi:hypothetical protein